MYIKFIQTSSLTLIKKKSYPRISFEYIFLLETLDKYVLKKKKRNQTKLSNKLIPNLIITQKTQKNLCQRKFSKRRRNRRRRIEQTPSNSSPRPSAIFSHFHRLTSTQLQALQATGFPSKLANTEDQH